MEWNAFAGGTDPGGLTTGHEIRILVCYVLAGVKERMAFTQLQDALLKKGLVNYFELADAVSELQEAGHIAFCSKEDGGTECYELTPLGARTAEEFGPSLPLSVREKAIESAKRLLRHEKYEAENIATMDKVRDGYMVNLVISDIGSDLMNLSLFVPTAAEAETVKQQFLGDPLLIYKGMLALLTGDMKTVGELVPTDELHD